MKRYDRERDRDRVKEGEISKGRNKMQRRERKWDTVGERKKVEIRRGRKIEGEEGWK